MITKLTWQWQSSNNDLSTVSTSTSTRNSTTNPQRGRVITGMLTSGDQYQDPAKSGKGTRNNY